MKLTINTKKHKPIIYAYYGMLQSDFLGEENGISAKDLADRMGITVRAQRYILQEINQSKDLDKIISTSDKIYMCNTEQECVRAFMNEIKTGITRIKKGKKMAQKVGLNGQYKFKLGKYYKDLVTVFDK